MDYRVVVESNEGFGVVNDYTFSSLPDAKQKARQTSKEDGYATITDLDGKVLYSYKDGQEEQD